MACHKNNKSSGGDTALGSTILLRQQQQKILELLRAYPILASKKFRFNETNCTPYTCTYSYCSLVHPFWQLIHHHENYNMNIGPTPFWELIHRDENYKAKMNPTDVTTIKEIYMMHPEVVDDGNFLVALSVGKPRNSEVLDFLLQAQPQILTKRTGERNLLPLELYIRRYMGGEGTDFFRSPIDPRLVLRNVAIMLKRHTTTYSKGKSHGKASSPLTNHQALQDWLFNLSGDFGNQKIDPQAVEDLRYVLAGQPLLPSTHHLKCHLKRPVDNYLAVILLLPRLKILTFSFSHLPEWSLLCVLQSVLQRTSGASLRLELPIWLEQLTPRVQQALRQVLVTNKSAAKELAIDLIYRFFYHRDDNQLLSALAKKLDRALVL